MKKLVSITLALVMCLFCFASCASEVDNSKDLEYIQEKGSLIVGITLLEPLDFKGENGEWVGFDAELAKAVGEKLGVEVKFQEIDWKAKEAELAAKNIDCIWNGLTITPERQEEMSITNPYMINKQVIVVRSEDSGNYSDINSLAGKTIAAEAGSAGEEVVQNKISDAKYVEKGVQLDALTEVKGKTADAAVIDYVMANYLINKEGSAYSDLTILDMNLSDPENYGIAFRKGSNTTAKVNEVLSELAESGVVADIASKYGLSNSLLELK